MGNDLHQFSDSPDSAASNQKLEAVKKAFSAFRADGQRVDSVRGSNPAKYSGSTSSSLKSALFPSISINDGTEETQRRTGSCGSDQSNSPSLTGVQSKSTEDPTNGEQVN